ncbi:hypothetical protein DL96DRAFT_1627327 [Flagelloscypha sp. PMI_526]|nr:hypothetical protein DL96DRAFT_1627327 [Flagelloscypha sp. PMI_526]
MSQSAESTSLPSLERLTIDIARMIIEWASEIDSGTRLSLSLTSKEIQMWSDPALFWHLVIGYRKGERFQDITAAFLSGSPPPSERLLRARNLLRILTVAPRIHKLSASYLLQCVCQCPNIQQLFYRWPSKGYALPSLAIRSLNIPMLSSLYITVNPQNLISELRSPLFTYLRHLDLSEQFDLGTESAIPFWESLPSLSFLETLTLEWRTVEPPFPYSRILSYVPPSFRVLIVIWGLTWADTLPSPDRDELVQAVREGDVDERIVLGQALYGGSKNKTWVVMAYEEPGEKFNIWRPPILRREWEAIYEMVEERKRWRRSRTL